MRRLLLAVALAGTACLAAGPAAADPCDPETGTCHPRDCLAYDPYREAEQVAQAAGSGDAAAVVSALDSCY